MKPASSLGAVVGASHPCNAPDNTAEHEEGTSKGASSSSDAEGEILRRP